MRDVTIIGQFNKIGEAIKSLNEMIISTMQHVQLGFSGNALHEEAIKSLLMKKGIITDTEFKEALGEEIRKVNEAQAEAQKKAKEEQKIELIKPSAEETKVVEESKEAK